MVYDLSIFRNVPVSFNELASLLNDYYAPKNKVSEMERTGQLIRLKKGLYVVSQKESNLAILPELVANHLHGPSYVSQQTALRIYGLIPEHVYATTSVTTRRAVVFENPIGRFVYTHVAPEYYAIGVCSRESDGVFYQIATPEKALCDLIVSTSGLRLRSVPSLLEYLEEDLRFDMGAFREMNPDVFRTCAAVSKKSPTLLNIVKLLTK